MNGSAGQETEKEGRMGKAVTHFEIVGRDAEALQGFYRDVFGWEVEPAVPNYAMVYTRAGTGIDGGIGNAPEGSGATRVTIYIEVEDVGSVLTRIESLGGTRAFGPFAVPGGPTIALFNDPEGNLVGLTQSASIQRR